MIAVIAFIYACAIGLFGIAAAVLFWSIILALLLLASVSTVFALLIIGVKAAAARIAGVYQRART